jgi:FKBP-type peptidyl-prolyl cis-trans isomerase FkpA
MRLQPFLLFATTLACAAACASAQTATKTTSSTAAKKSSTAPNAVHRATGGPTTDDEKAIYSIGLGFYNFTLSQLNLSPAELELVKRALSDAAAGKPAVDLKVWGPKIDPLMKARAGKVSTAFLTKCAAEPGAVKMPSGLIYRDLKPGTGASPSAEDKVKVNYRGTFINGKEFDSSYARNEPAEFPLSNVIRCWTEGVQKMKVGGKARLVCPSDIAYGDQGRPGIPGGSTLIFEIELLSVAGK